MEETAAVKAALNFSKNVSSVDEPLHDEPTVIQVRESISAKGKGFMFGTKQ